MPGFSRAQWSRLSGYSLKMIASSPTASPTARLKVAALSAVGVCVLRGLGAARLMALDQLRAARLDIELLLRQRRVERRQRDRRRRGDRQIARERAHRIAREGRVLADMRDAAAGGRLLGARIPRRVALDHDDEVGLADQRAGIVSRHSSDATTAARPSAHCARPPGSRRARRPWRAPRPRSRRCRARP